MNEDMEKLDPIIDAFPGSYILDGKVPKKCYDLDEFATWLNSNSRVVRQDQVGELFVSTVFLATDHNWSGDASHPILFETMIFKDGTSWSAHEGGEYQERYSTWDEAELGHERALKYVRDKTLKTPK